MVRPLGNDGRAGVARLRTHPGGRAARGPDAGHPLPVQVTSTALLFELETLKIQSPKKVALTYFNLFFEIVIVETNLHAVRGPHKIDKNGMLFLLLSLFFGVKEMLKTVLTFHGANIISKNA